MTIENTNTDERGESICFSFGDPDSALVSNPAKDLLGVSLFAGEQEYYNPPMSFKGLSLLARTNPQHSPLAHFKARNVCKYLKPNALIKRKHLYPAVFEHQSVGNAFIKLIRNKAKGVIGIGNSPALNTRRMKEKNRYCWIDKEQNVKPYKKGEILHIKQYDPMQNIYGVPYWVGAMQSILLGEEIRLFPRRFFKNGAHAGALIFTSGLLEGDRKRINEKFKATKQGGSMSSLGFHFPKGEIDKMIKVHSMSENAAKIDYSKLAKMTALDILEAWGIRPELVGQIPEGLGASGDLDKLIRMDHELNTVPLQQDFADAFNEFLPARHQLEFYTFDELNSSTKTAS